MGPCVRSREGAEGHAGTLHPTVGGLEAAVSCARHFPALAAGQQQVLMSLPAKLLSEAVYWLPELSTVASQPRDAPPEVGIRQQPAAFQVVERKLKRMIRVWSISHLKTA